MPTLLDEPLRALLEEPDADQAPASVQALVVRAARLAFEVGAHVPESAIVRALSAPSNETLLDELASLLLADATTASLAAPGDIASAEAPRGRRRGDDRRAILRARFAGHLKLRRLIDATGGLLRADEAQELLNVSRATLQQWRDARRVLALPLGGMFAYPAVQFVPASTDLEPPRPMAGLQEVLMTAGDRLQPAELFALLATPQPAFGPAEEGGTAEAPGWRSGFDALRAGDTERVALLVRELVTPADEGAPAAAANHGGR